MTTDAREIGPDGGSLRVDLGTVVFAPGALPVARQARLQATRLPDLDSRFDEGTWMMEPSFQRGAGELQLELSGGENAPGAYALDLRLPQAVRAEIARGAEFALFYLQTHASDDDEQAESHDTFLRVPAIVGDDGRHVRAQLPAASLQLLDDGRRLAILKYGWTPPQAAGAASACARPLPVDGPGDATRWVSPLARQLMIVGPFGEPGHAGGAHTGIDFRTVPIGRNLPVRAVRSGYIERIRVGACTGPSAACANADDRQAFVVIVRHPDRSVTRYVHLENFSAVHRGGYIGGADRATVQQYWVETRPGCPQYPVRRGDVIARSGWTGTYSAKTGAFAPHLHLGWAAPATQPRNAITRLGALKLHAGTPPLVLTAPASADAGQASVGLFDFTSGQEILVRRRKDAELFLPVTAQGSQFSFGSAWPVLQIEHAFEPASSLQAQSQFFPQFTLPASGRLLTDGGGFRLVSDASDGVEHSEQFIFRAAGVHAVRSGVITQTEPDALELPITVVIRPGSFSGPLTATGPAAITGSSCSGTVTWTGTATVRLTAGAELLNMKGTESFRLNCWGQDMASELNVPLVRSGNALAGDYHLPFTCPGRCVAGSLDVSVRATLTGLPPNQSLQGTLTYVNQNQTPFYARGTGTLALTPAAVPSP